MKKSIRRIIAIAFSILGTVLGLYVGGYLLFLQPLRGLFVALTVGEITKKFLLISIVKIFLASTAGGSIWCICDIIAGFFRDEPEADKM